MKRIITLFTLALSLALTTSCEKNKTTSTEETIETTDPATAKSEIIANMDKFHDAFRNKKAEDIKILLNENGLYCGTDPSETFGYEGFIQYLNLKLTNPAIGTIGYKIDRREISLDKNNPTNAIVVDQFKMDVFTQNIMWRMVSHLTKKDNVWKIDFISLTLVPENDIVPAINIAAHKIQ